STATPPATFYPLSLHDALPISMREPEGPFGEFPQYYGERANRHVIQVDAVTHRMKPIFHTIVGGGLEHLLLGAIPREATILATLDRKSTRLNSSHVKISYAVFC